MSNIEKLAEHVTDFFYNMAKGMLSTFPAEISGPLFERALTQRDSILGTYRNHLTVTLTEEEAKELVTYINSKPACNDRYEACIKIAGETVSANLEKALADL